MTKHRFFGLAQTKSPLLRRRTLGPGRSVIRVYCCVVAGLLFTFVGATAVFVMLVSPYGHAPLGFALVPLEQGRPARNSDDRTYRAYDPFAVQPRTLFLGTSRFNRGLPDKSLPAGFPEPVYIAGLNGADIATLSAYFDFWMAAGLPIERVVIDLYYWRMIPRPDNPSPPPDINPLRDVLQLRASFSAALAALRLAASQGGEEHNADSFTLRGVLARPNAPGGQSLRGGFRNWWMEARQLAQPIHPPARESVKAISQTCRNYAVDCRFVFGPIHSFRLAAFDQAGLLPVIESTIKQLVEIVPVYDFTMPHKQTWDDWCGTTTVWYDPGHYTPAIGRLMLEILADDERTEKIGGWGRRLDDPAKVTFEELRRSVRDWRARHPWFTDYLAGKTDAPDCSASPPRK